MSTKKVEYINKAHALKKLDMSANKSENIYEHRGIREAYGVIMRETPANVIKVADIKKWLRQFDSMNRKQIMSLPDSPLRKLEIDHLDMCVLFANRMIEELSEKSVDKE